MGPCAALRFNSPALTPSNFWVGKTTRLPLALLLLNDALQGKHTWKYDDSGRKNTFPQTILVFRVVDLRN
jgi:hypothetical protein